MENAPSCETKASSMFPEDIAAGKVTQIFNAISNNKATGADKTSAKIFNCALSVLIPYVTQVFIFSF